MYLSVNNQCENTITLLVMGKSDYKHFVMISKKFNQVLNYIFINQTAVFPQKVKKNYTHDLRKQLSNLNQRSKHFMFSDIHVTFLQLQKL